MASGGGGVITWEQDLTSLVADTGIQYRFPAAAADGPGLMEAADAGVGGGTAFGGYEGGSAAAAAAESFKDQMKGFLMASGELLLELGRSCRDIMRQSLVGVEDTYAVREMRRACGAVSARLKFLNDYLPEDRDPAHAWPVVILVFLLALTGV